MANQSFWRGKRVLVTGHTGFKGAWLGLWLHVLGAKTAGFSLASPTSPSLFEAGGVADCLSDVRGDVRDLPALLRAFEEHRPEVVVHMAAQSLVRRSYRQPVETFATNVMGTANVLEAARQAGDVKAALVVTSDKCYHNANLRRGYRENDPMGGRDPYSSSKGCAELVTEAYRASFFSGCEEGGTLVASARSGNVIGGGDFSEDRLVPDLARAFSEGRGLKVRNPDAVRPWQHVLEPLEGYLLLLEKLYRHGREFAGGWNFGPSGRALPVRSVVDRCVRLWGGQASWEVDQAPQAPEAARLVLDSGKARQFLGWHPRLTNRQALAWTVSWYKRFFKDPSSAGRLCLDDIRRYEALRAGGAGTGL